MNSILGEQMKHLWWTDQMLLLLVSCDLLLFVSAQDPKPHSATLHWTQGAPQIAGDCPVTSNKIYRSTAPNQETLFASIAAATSYTDTTVRAGVTYYYKVSAQNCGGESPLSSEVRATIPHKPGAKDQP